MGLEAVIDVVLHLGYFKTFDMLAQGTYRLRIIMELKDSHGEVFRATPYLWLNNQFSHHKIVQKLYDTDINNNNYSASTPSFYIRYCDQECLINQMVIFRVEIPLELLQTSQIEIKFELLNLDLGDDDETPPKNAKKQKERDQDGFSVLTHASIKSKLIQDCYHDFVNIVFPDYLFSYLDVFIHSTLIRLKYRGNQPLPASNGAKKGVSLPQKSPSTLNQYLAQKLTAKPGNVHEKELEVFPRLLLQQFTKMLECIDRLVHLFQKTYLQDEIDAGHSLTQSSLKTSKVFGSSRNKLVEQFLELKESLPSCGMVFDGLSVSEAEQNLAKSEADATEVSSGHIGSIIRSGVVSSALGSSLAKVSRMPFDKLIEISSGDVEVAIEKLIEISMVADGNIQGYFFKLTDLLFICFKPMLTEYREAYQVKQRRFLLANKVHSQVFQIDDLGYSFGHKIKEMNNETSNKLRSSPHLQQGIDSATNMSFTVPAEDASFLFVETYQLQPASDKMDKLVSEFHQVKDLGLSRTSSGGSMDRPSTTSTQSGHRKTRSRVADFEKMDSFAIVPSFLGSDTPTRPQLMETPRETFVPELRKPSEQTTQLSFDNMLAGIDDEPKMEMAAPGLQWSTLDAPVQVPVHNSERLGVSTSEPTPIKIGKRRSMVVEERPTTNSRPGTGDLDLNTEPEAVQTASVAPTSEESMMAESVLVQAPVKSSPLQDGELLPTKTVKAVQDRLSEPQGAHLVVFVHGYEGCSFDMKTLKNMFCYTAKPHVVCHCATANETDSTTDIEAQGGLLAEEVLELVKFNFSPDSGAESQVLQNFVGHSLGGLVIRAALPRLVSLASKMHALLTFGTPHLGCSNGNSTLIKTGFKVFTRIMGHKSLNQMNLTDASEIKNTFLMKLSAAIGMEWFSHIILFSSYQDLYVPAESARIEYGDIEQRDKKRSHYFKRMVQNLTGRLRNGRLVRVDMNIKQSGTLNNLTGRQAHIKILDTLELQALVVYTFGEYLD